VGLNPPRAEGSLDLDGIVRDIQALQGLVDSPGWALLSQTLVSEANEATKQWMRGGLDLKESDRLASRVSTLGWVLDWPKIVLDDRLRALNEAQDGRASDDPRSDDPSVTCPIEGEDNHG